MAYTKAQIFNLALGALLLSRRIQNSETDTSNEANVLRTHWQAALDSTLSDLDLDATSSTDELALLDEEPDDVWLYVYTYPSDCVKLRRLKPPEGGQVVDSRYTQIRKRVGQYEGATAIFTNQEDSLIEYISNEVPISALNSEAGLALAYRLAELSAPLIVGKGASKLRQEIQVKYATSKAQAKRLDREENENFQDDDVQSEFVLARLE